MSFIPWFRRRYACGTGKSFVKEKALRDASAGVLQAHMQIITCNSKRIFEKNLANTGNS